MTLMDDKSVLNLDFANSGDYIAASIGEKNRGIATPGMRWSISQDGDLLIRGGDKKRVMTLHLLEYTKKRVLVLRRGKVETYKIQNRSTRKCSTGN